MNQTLEAPSDPLWTCRDVARFLRRSPRWVSYALCRSEAEAGSIPHYRLPGRGPRFLPGEIQEWVRGGCPPVADFRLWQQREGRGHPTVPLRTPARRTPDADRT